MFFVTAGYHRYFAHKSFSTGRAMQFVFAFGGLTAAQKGPLWWAAHHRTHHRYTDTERDPHTPLARVLVEPRRLDPLGRVRRHRTTRPSATSRSIPSCGS